MSTVSTDPSRNDSPTTTSEYLSWFGVWSSSSLKVQGSGFDVELLVYSAVHRHEGESIFVELMTSDCNLKASRESSK